MLTLDELFAQFLRERTYLRNVSPKTLIWYETAWKAYRRGLTSDADVHALTRQSIQGFIIGLRDRRISPVSCNTWLKALNAFCRWLHDEGYLPQPLRLAPLKVPKRLLVTLDVTTLRMMLAFKPKGFAQCRVFAVVATMLDTGSRIDELLSANTQAFDLDNLLITLRGKGDKERKVPFGLELRKILYRYHQQREVAGLRSDLMFAAVDG